MRCWGVLGGQISRRGVLVGLGAVLFVSAGCSTQSPDPPPRGAADTPPRDPDEPIREAAADAERALLVSYAATIARHPSLSERLMPLAAHHSEHEAALFPTTPIPAASATASPTVSTRPTTFPPVPVPDDPAAAVTELAVAERAAAARTLHALPNASPGLARLLASVGGAEAAHAALLGS